MFSEEFWNQLFFVGMVNFIGMRVSLRRMPEPVDTKQLFGGNGSSNVGMHWKFGQNSNQLKIQLKIKIF